LGDPKMSVSIIPKRRLRVKEVDNPTAPKGCTKLGSRIIIRQLFTVAIDQTYKTLRCGIMLTDLSSGAILMYTTVASVARPRRLFLQLILK
jgi:hypothetical protein